MNLGNNLFYVRKAKGLSQAELIEFDIDTKEPQVIIDKTSDKVI
ncbi:MAG: hypothetical protein RSC10_07295 [Longicatena sp.]